MKIGFDGHKIGNRKTGDETYSIDLLNALSFVDINNQYEIYLTKTNNVLEFSKNAKNFRTKIIYPPQRIPRILLLLPFYAKKDRLDLLHVHYVAPPLCPCPFVVTVHDLSFFRHPEFFTRFDRMWMRTFIPYTIRRSAKVITTSEHSRKDIIALTGVSEKDVIVTYAGVSKHYRAVNSDTELKNVLNNYGISFPYFLYVGNLQPRKNLRRILNAYVDLRLRKVCDIGLVLVGQKAWMYSDIFSALRKVDLDRIVFTGYIPDEHMPHMYSGATALIYPSLYEGFGLPILEAMSCGAPVITSDRSSMPEVAGDAAILVNPASTIEIINAMEKVISSEGLRQDLIGRGLERIKKFNWRETAEKTLEVYESVGSRWL